MAESKKSAAKSAADDVFGFALDAAPEAPKAETKVPDGTRMLLPRAEIEPWELNPRKRYNAADLDDLGQDIKSRGQLNDLLVRPYPDKPGFWQLLGGERRWRSTAPDVGDVPLLWVKVMNPANDAEALDIAWADNAKRSDLTAMENARYIRIRGEMALESGESDSLRAVGKAAELSYERVRQIKNLLELPDWIQEAFDDLELNEKHGRALLMLTEFPDEQLTLFRTIERSSLSGNAAVKRAQELRKQAENDAQEQTTQSDDEGAAAAAAPLASAPTTSRAVELEANAAPRSGADRQRR